VLHSKGCPGAILHSSSDPAFSSGVLSLPLAISVKVDSFRSLSADEHRVISDGLINISTTLPSCVRHETAAARGFSWLCRAC